MSPDPSTPPAPPEARAEPASARPSPPPSSQPPAGEPLMQTLQSVWRELPGLLGDRVELLGLELKRAGAALSRIVAMLLVAAILGLTAWLLAWGVLIGVLTALGLPMWAALLAALAVNAVGIAVALGRAKAAVPLLKLPATRRHLVPRPLASRVPGPAGADDGGGSGGEPMPAAGGAR